MSHKNPIRNDKTCLNCNYVVAGRFCPNCGQENSDTRKTFYHLFVHFFEDLTHYENAFWKTIKNLLIRPASLTKEYLSGKRLSYLAPIRLYIFISFITFFVFAIAPNFEDETEMNTKKMETKREIDTIYSEQQKIIDLEKKGVLSKNDSDSIQKLIVFSKEKKIQEKSSNISILGNEFQSVADLDSIQKKSDKSKKLGNFEYWFTRKIIFVQENFTSEEIKEKFFESFSRNIPKALFIYMPLFAFILWIFHNKKRWYYFDHGIFTLHYFSFLLLATLIVKLQSILFSYLNDYMIFIVINYIFKFFIIFYILYYFFPAHNRFYEETKTASFFKGIAIFIINIIFIVLILTLFAIYTFINIH